LEIEPFVIYVCTIKLDMDTTRRGFLSTASLSAVGLAAAASSLSSLIPEKANAATAASIKSGFTKAPEELEDFVYDIEHGSKGYNSPGGTAKEATVEEFPVSQSIVGVSMRLNPGSFREMHWHSLKPNSR
jgi:oxalate decarboxylase